MSWINRYLDIEYEDGGRGPLRYDCWGLVREVRAEVLGLRPLPSYGSLRNTDPRSFTRAYRDQSSMMVECEPEHGAIASVLVGSICTHVAVVLEIEGELKVLEINPERGARCMRLNNWVASHLKVTFHKDSSDDRSLCQPPE